MVYGALIFLTLTLFLLSLYIGILIRACQILIDPSSEKDVKKFSPSAFRRSSITVDGVKMDFPGVYPQPILASRTPLGTDIDYPLGQLWINTKTREFFGLSNVTEGWADWENLRCFPTTLKNK